MPYKNLKRRTERSKMRRKENPQVHRTCDARYKRTIKGQYSYLKVRAKKRGIEVYITEEEFANVRGSSCYYCHGDLPEIGSGLDRIDNTQGYTRENVVPCCGSCNRVRGNDLTHEELVVGMNAITQYRMEKKTVI